MSTNYSKHRPQPLARTRSSSSSSDSSLKPPRTPRFAEATSVNSPIEHKVSPFADPPSGLKANSFMAQSQPSDIGFGYIEQHVEVPMTPASPLKSAMKMPGATARWIENPLSPTFKEEQALEKKEGLTEAQQKKDLKIKTRVRVAKFLLRGVNFSCSLIVLSMLSVTMTIFDATKELPARNNLPPWAVGTKTWPQKVVLATSCVSLALCLLVFWGYIRGGHRRAEKVAVYYTMFAVGFFIFSTVMWAIAAGILQGARSQGNGKDMWGWSCADNARSQVFSQDIHYALVCRLQSWSLVCCLIEVILECITILLYGVVFYRYYSKQRLRKTMDMRDKARSDLYLAQLRTQSAPNTPGFGPMSPSYSMHLKSPRFPAAAYTSLSDDPEDGAQFAEARSNAVLNSKPFTLQPPPIKTHPSPILPQSSFPAPPPARAPLAERRAAHMAAAPGEQTYDAVPIPGAYPTRGKPGSSDKP